ncbi:hypothetical protein [Nannocystis pusilla]|uniref:hypothetical protein n=1 Tax=Nannocystis pusilla TaxID=889268 RepID=UPI003B7CEE2B
MARSHGLVRRLECAGPGRANLSEGADPSGGRGTEFVVRGAELDPTRARTYLADVARFAPAAVRVDGTDISDGLRGYLARAELELPQFKLRGTVALAHRGEPARIWLLVHGVVSTHVGVTRAPCFEAVVELADKFAAGELTPAATAADLREAIAPALEAIVDAGVQLMLATGARSASLPATSQARVLHLLLQALRSRRRAAEVLALPVVPALVSRDERRWLAIESLPALARPEPAFALEPEQNPDDFALPGPPVLLLGTAERGSWPSCCSCDFARRRRAKRADAGLGRAVAELATAGAGVRRGAAAVAGSDIVAGRAAIPGDPAGGSARRGRCAGAGRAVRRGRFAAGGRRAADPVPRARAPRRARGDRRGRDRRGVGLPGLHRAAGRQRHAGHGEPGDVGPDVAPAVTRAVMTPVRVDDPDDPRLADYRELEALGHRPDPHRFIAESELVVERLLHSPYPVASVLTTESHCARLGPALAARPEVPVYVGDQALLRTVVGFNFHRGVAACGVRPPALRWNDMSPGTALKMSRRTCCRGSARDRPTPSRWPRA